MKRTETILLSCILVACLTGCGSKAADEEQIKQDIMESKELQLSEEEQIEEIVIEKRQTDKEDREDLVWCSIVTSDDKVRYQKDIKLTYELYDKKGWVLDDIDVEPREKWSIEPLQGAEENLISKSLYGQVLVIGEEEWQITEESLLNAELEKQQTNLERKEDEVTVSLMLDEKLEKAEGKIDILFIFDQEWKFDSIISIDDFAVSLKEEYSLNVSEDNLMAEIIENGLPVGNTKQEISVEKQEMTDFKINEQKSESKGSRQVYECSYKINKSKVIMEGESTIAYVYKEGDGWSSSVRKTETHVVSADIEGSWTGIHNGNINEEKAELYIEEVKDDGTVTGTYKFYSENKYSPGGSYEVFGTWKKESLELWLEAGDWIEEPEKIGISNSKKKITAELNLEKDRIEGHAQGGTRFIVTKD